MQRSHIQRFAAMAVAAATLGFAGIAGAADAHEDERVTSSQQEVFYADLDLRRADDAKELYARIERGARQVCRVGEGPSVREWVAARSCVQNAVQEAVHSVGNANLTSVHASRAGRRSVLAANR